MKYLVHEAARLLGRDAELLREAIGGQPVGQPVGHRLDPAPHHRVDGRGVDLEHVGRHRCVQVLTRLEGREQRLVARQVRHDAHLDLAVVGRQQRLVAGADDERSPDPAPFLRTDRDVLQVRVLRAQPARRRHDLVVRRMDPAVVGDRLLQALDRDEQLGDVTMPEQVRQQRVLGLHEQALQRVCVGGVAGLDPLGLRQAEVVEQDRLQLLG